MGKKKAGKSGRSHQLNAVVSLLEEALCRHFYALAQQPSTPAFLQAPSEAEQQMPEQPGPQQDVEVHEDEQQELPYMAQTPVRCASSLQNGNFCRHTLFTPIFCPACLQASEQRLATWRSQMGSPSWAAAADA
jgi:hypothetical protein